MFGIVGYVGDKDVAPLLIEPLKRLEYRSFPCASRAGVPRRARDPASSRL